MQKSCLAKKLILAGGLLLCAWPGAGTAQAASAGAVVWGYHLYDQTTVPVAAQSEVTVVAAGYFHTVVKTNGSVVAWGDNYHGQTTVRDAAQSGVTAIAAGAGHTVALKSDGSVLAWGNNSAGQVSNVPDAAQSGVTAVAAGGFHTVALTNDGSVPAWGDNSFGQTTVPVAAQSGVTAIAAGTYHIMALLGTAPPLSLADWAAGFGLSGAAAAADADPDRDGPPNGVEYIFGGNPSAPDTSGRTVAVSSEGNLVFTFCRDDFSETPDITLTVESGTDLVTWPAVLTIGPNTSSSGPGVNITENGTAPDTITVTIPRAGNARIFARLKVTITP